MISHKKIKKTILTPIVPPDASLLFNWRNDPAIFAWTRQNDLLNWENHSQWMVNHQNDSSIKMYMIKHNGVAVGVCGLTDIDLVNQRAEFSLYISPDHHRQGFGKDSLRLLLWHGFSAYPFNTIWGETFEGNPALDMFLKAGFVKEGTRREFYYRGGKFIDSHIVSIKREEFLSKWMK
jgi:RimJ/RimL family protein N-acetyltransferase